MAIAGKTKNSISAAQDNHLAWIDLLRCFAICCVVLVHVNDSIYSSFSNPEFFVTQSTRTIIFSMTVQTIGRLGVPIFLFITGYLLLDRKYDYAGTIRFWKRNLLGIFIPTEIWIAIYEVFRAFFVGETFSVTRMLREMLFLQEMTGRGGHMWYMFTMIGIYLFLPFVAMVLQKFEDKLFLFPMLILFAYLFVVPLISLLLGYYGHGTLSVRLSLSFGGGVYGFMVVLGYFLKKGLFHKVKSRYLIIIGIACILITIWIQKVAYANSLQSLFSSTFYNTAFLLIATICIFLLVSRIKRVPIPKIIRNLAMCSFGIYLIHYPVRLIMQRYINISSRGAKIAVVSLLTLLISWGCVWLLSRVPKLGKILFYVRRDDQKKENCEKVEDKQSE